MHVSLLSTFAAATCLVGFGKAHSWVDLLRNIANDGSFTGEPGYPRGYHNHSEAGFDDKTMVYLVDQQDPNPGLCMADQQLNSPRTPGAVNLQATPDSMIALLYQENGHVTLPQNQPGKPPNRGTIYIYGTTQPAQNETFNNVFGKWTADGKGGDGRGKLLSMQNFDDGQCYQKNTGDISDARQQKYKIQAATLPEGSDLWCQNNLIVPSDAAPGKPYTLYWVWSWPTAPGAPGLPEGKNETYTTCMDIDITAGSSNSKAAAVPIKFAQTSDIQGAALPAAVKQMASGSNIFVQDPAKAASGASVASAAAPAAGATTAVSPIVKSAAALSDMKYADVLTQPPASQASAAASSLVINPVPTGSVPVASPSATAAASPAASTAVASAAPVSVSVSIQTVVVTVPAATAAASTAAVLSEAPVSGSSGPMAPAAAATSSAAATASAPIGTVAPANSSVAAPSPNPCKAPGANKNSVIFAGEGAQGHTVKRSLDEESGDQTVAAVSGSRADVIKEPLQEALQVRTRLTSLPRSHRRSAKFYKQYTH